MFFGLIEGINGLITKGMSNIYWKVTTENHWLSQNFNFLSLKNLTSHKYHWILKLLVAT